MENVEKHVLQEGTTPIPPDPDTKVKFYYKTFKTSDGNVLDDNRPTGSPLELIFGKQFKLEIWEQCLKTMKSGEIARFRVGKEQVGNYPFVAKSLRDINKGKNPSSCGHDHGDEGGGKGHCCGMQTMMEKGLGYPDLDELLKAPEDLEFEIEVTEVFEPGTYEKDNWLMESQEKLESIPRFHQEGNTLYSKKKYVEANDRYSRALAALEDLQGREKPDSDEWQKYDVMMIPLLLNYVQCQIILKHYNEAIHHATSIIQKDPKNVKAWYRRAKAHAEAWNPKEARDDFARALELDPSLESLIAKDLRELDRVQAVRDVEDREKMRKLFG